MNSKKHQIDRKRDGALTIELCDPDDGTPIRKLISVAGDLLAITDKSIFLTQLADDVDPERTNINVPNIHRKELNYGFKNEVVQRIFLLAEAMFDKTHLGYDRDCEAAIASAWDATKLLLEMQEIQQGFKTEIDKIVEKGLLPDVGRSQNIPSVNSLETGIHTFAKKADQVRGIAVQFIKLFYKPEPGKKVIEKLEAAISLQHGENSQMLAFYQNFMPFIRFLRNLRNAIEHPNADEQLVVLDFHPTPEITIDPPTLELIHPATPQERINIISFMEQLVESLVDILEVLIINLCANNLGHFGKFECAVGAIEGERAEGRGVRYSYFVKLNNEWQPLG
ncbi:MAG: hypothetical protein JKX81_15135 [Arenicella sp.]|nr:hypothetical protein [Arenicella sp.]